MPVHSNILFAHGYNVSKTLIIAQKFINPPLLYGIQLRYFRVFPLLYELNSISIHNYC